MENFTFAQKLLKPHTIDPLEGHTVVVFETVGQAGEEFRFEIEPGMRVPKARLELFKWLRREPKAPRFFAYAVNGDPELRLRFSTRVQMDNQAHAVMITGCASYSVADPKLLVTRRNDDPLRKMRDELALMMQRQFAPQSWISVRNDFRGIEREVIEATREPLRRFAGAYGIDVRDVSLALALDDHDIVDLKHEAAIDQQVEIDKREAERERLKITEETTTQSARAEQQHRLELRKQVHSNELERLQNEHLLENAAMEDEVVAVLARRQVNEAFTKATVLAIGTAGTAIRTPAELVQAMTDIQQVVGRSQGGMMPPGQSLGPAGVRGELHAAQSGAQSIVAEMFLRTEELAWSLPQKRTLQSAILHLVAESLLDGDAAPATLETYRARVADLRAEQGLAREQFEYLKKFVDLERLHDELR